MVSSADYLEFARECVRWALETELERDREDFLELARDWTIAALLAEAKESAGAGF